jgi:glyoxylase-like metal-dependent hydrolase (beta-lactamase superfamily II)
MAPAAGAPGAPGAGLRSYLEARQVLDAAVTAIGGEPALRSVSTVRRQYSGDWYGSGQGPRPEPFAGPTLTPPRANGRNRVTSYVDYATGRCLEESVESDLAGDSILRVTAAGEKEGFEAITYRDERPFYRAFSEGELAALRRARLRRHPEGILRMALDRPETLQWLGEGDESGRRQQIISMTDPDGARVMLYFDATTHLLSKSEILRSHPIAGDSSWETIYDDYRAAGRLRLPFRWVDRRAGVPVETAQASAIDLDASFPEDRLRPPKRFARMDEVPAAQTLENLGDGLYLIRGPYNTLFAVFRDYVLAIEAPVGSRYGEKALALIRTAAPGKPVQFLVSTHFHFDHVAGVRPFVAAGAAIVTTSDAREAIERVVSARHTMVPDALSRAVKTPRIEIVSRKRVFDDGAQRVEIYDFGPTEHAEHLLVPYFPKQKLLFVADLWDVISTEQPSAGSDTVSMARTIRNLGLDVERIIPVHGTPGTLAMLRAALAVRAKYFPNEPRPFRERR